MGLTLGLFVAFLHLLQTSAHPIESQTNPKLLDLNALFKHWPQDLVEKFRYAKIGVGPDANSIAIVLPNTNVPVGGNGGENITDFQSLLTGIGSGKMINKRVNLIKDLDELASNTPKGDENTPIYNIKYRSLVNKKKAKSPDSINLQTTITEEEPILKEDPINMNGNGHQDHSTVLHYLNSRNKINVLPLTAASVAVDSKENRIILNQENSVDSHIENDEDIANKRPVVMNTVSLTPSSVAAYPSENITIFKLINNVHNGNPNNEDLTNNHTAVHNPQLFRPASAEVNTENRILQAANFEDSEDENNEYLINKHTAVHNPVPLTQASVEVDSTENILNPVYYVDSENEKKEELTNKHISVHNSELLTPASVIVDSTENRMLNAVNFINSANYNNNDTTHKHTVLHNLLASFTTPKGFISTKSRIILKPVKYSDGAYEGVLDPLKNVAVDNDKTLKLAAVAIVISANTKKLRPEDEDIINKNTEADTSVRLKAGLVIVNPELLQLIPERKQYLVSSLKEGRDNYSKTDIQRNPVAGLLRFMKTIHNYFLTYSEGDVF